MQLRTTEECVALIIQLYGYNFSNWKRARKYKEGGNTVRDFANDQRLQVKVVTASSHDFIGIGLVNALVNNDETIRALKKAAKTIKHCGDYGELWFQPTTQHVWWVAGDADGDPTGPTTPMSEISRIFLSSINTPVTKVFVEAEAYPDQSEGWVCLGKHGKVVDL